MSDLRSVYEAARSLTQAVGAALLPSNFCPKRELDGSLFHKCECGKCPVTSPPRNEEATDAS